MGKRDRHTVAVAAVEAAVWLFVSWVFISKLTNQKRVGLRWGGVLLQSQVFHLQPSNVLVGLNVVGDVKKLTAATALAARAYKYD